MTWMLADESNFPITLFCLAWLNCPVWISILFFQVFMPHQWLEGNLPVSAKCVVCDKNCGSVRRLQDWRCLWCKAIVSRIDRSLCAVKTCLVRSVVFQVPGMESYFESRKRNIWREMDIHGGWANACAFGDGVTASLFQEEKSAVSQTLIFSTV